MKSVQEQQAFYATSCSCYILCALFPGTIPSCTPETLGTDTTDFTKHDTAKRYFILDQRSPFEHSGTITKIELEAGSHPPTSDRPWTDDRSLEVQFTSICHKLKKNLHKSKKDIPQDL